MMIGYGNAQHVLVVSTELTRASRLALPILENTNDLDTFMGLVGALTVGDGAGAMVLSRKDNPSNGLHKINCRSWGQYAHLCRYNIVNGEFLGEMVMDRISALMLKLNGVLLKTTLAALDWTKGSIDHLVMHQVGQRPFDGMLKLMGVDASKAPKTLDKFGNLTTATIPANYAKLKREKRLKAGDQCLIVGGGSGIIISHLGLTV